MRKITKAVIPAAGYGTRLLPLSLVIPKEMLPVRLKPMIQYTVKEAIKAGITDIIIITRKEKGIIEEYFSHMNTSSYRDPLTEELIKIRKSSVFHYVNQDIPAGLGDAIYQAKHIIKDEPFCVLLPDNIYPDSESPIGQMIEKYKETGMNIVGVEKRPEDERPVNEAIYDYTEMDEDTLKVDKIYDKGYERYNKISYEIRGIGRYVFESEFFDYVEKVRKDFVLKELDDIQPMQLMALDRKLLGFLIKGKRYDTGYPSGYKEAHKNW